MLLEDDPNYLPSPLRAEGSHARGSSCGGEKVAKQSVLLAMPYQGWVEDLGFRGLQAYRV